MADETNNLTTPEHFALFKKEAQGFIDFFGLKDWQVDFKHAELDCRASCAFYCQGKTATLSLSTKWGESDLISPATIKRSAFHEVWELMLGDLYGAATDVDMTGRLRTERLERETHSVIRRMENVVLPLLPNN